VNVAILQESDGSWKMSGGLARSLKAGKPRQTLLQSPMPDHPWENMWLCIPDSLKLCLPPNSPMVGQIWCTMLAFQYARAEPFRFVENPTAPPSLQCTMDSRALAWLASQAAAYPTFAVHMDDVLLQADRCVSEWMHDHQQRVHELFLHHHQDKSQAAKVPLRARAAAVLGLAIRSHPVAALMFGKLAEPINRAERALLLVNMPLLMLTCTVAWYYSRSMYCCNDYQELLGCEPDITSGCLGYGTCSDLMQAASMLPKELDAEAWECKQFPVAESFIDRFWMIMFTVPVVLFSNTMLNVVFSMNRSGAVPAHFVRKKPSKCAKAKKEGLAANIQAGVFVLFGIFVEFELFVKSVVLYVTRFIMIVATPVAKVKTVLKHCIQCLSTCSWSAQARRLTVPSKRPNTWMHDGSSMAYTFIAASWMLILWVLLTMGAQIRAVMGKQEEDRLLTTFGINLAFEQFGVLGLRLVLMRMFVTWTFKHIDSIMASGDQDALSWFHDHVGEHLGDSSTVDMWTMLLNDNGVEDTDELQVDM